MNKILLSLSLASVMYGCNAAGREKNPLLQKDYALADTLHYDHTVIDALRESISGNISRLTPTMRAVNGAAGLEDALQFEYDVNADNSSEYEKLRAALKKQGYLLFKSEENFGTKPDKYAVLKTNNQFDIIKFRATNGANYDITNDSVMRKLHHLYDKEPFEITGADIDWVEVHLNKLNPADAMTFANDVYEFCPDLAEQGTETVENLAAEILETKQLFLWWD